jgi:hypothetical protein
MIGIGFGSLKIAGSFPIRQRVQYRRFFSISVAALMGAGWIAVVAVVVTGLTAGHPIAAYEGGFPGCLPNGFRNVLLSFPFMWKTFFLPAFYLYILSFRI